MKRKQKGRPQNFYNLQVVVAGVNCGAVGALPSASALVLGSESEVSLLVPGCSIPCNRIFFFNRLC